MPLKLSLNEITVFFPFVLARNTLEIRTKIKNENCTKGREGPTQKTFEAPNTGDERGCIDDKMEIKLKNKKNKE